MIKLLDCTLRDGGHVNNADFGKETIRKLVFGLADAGIDYVELGFLKNGCYTEDQAIFNDVSDIYAYLPPNWEKTVFTVMIRPDWYDIRQLSYSAGIISTIRFAFYYDDIELMQQQAKIVREKGYRFICNPVNIMGYSAGTLSELVNRINEIHPEQLTIVDTYGAMGILDLQRIYDTIERHLAPDIRLGLHLHENQSLSFGLAQEFLRIKEPEREGVIDASLLGMGRVPGNLCIEIAADYLNSVYGCNYKMDTLYELIGNYIEPIKKKIPWGYSPAYFIAARLNMHRSYAESLLQKNELNLYDINKILHTIDESMRSKFHGDYLEEKYKEYRRKYGK